MENQQYLYKCANHSANLKEMRLNNVGCDVSIRVEDTEFRAHKIILAANLKYFKSIFFNSSRESEIRSVIDIECLKKKDIEAFINYAYTGEILLTSSNASSLLEAANYFNESGIEDACIEFLKKHSTTDALSHGKLVVGKSVIGDSGYSKSQQMQHEVEDKVQALILVGLTKLKYYFQSYIFTKRKWSAPQRHSRTNSYVRSQSSTLNNKLYFLTETDGRYSLYELDTTKKKNKSLHSRTSILHNTAMCSCNQFIYFCGGGQPASDSVLRYDPLKKSFDTLPPMTIKRADAAAIFYQGSLHVLGGGDDVIYITKKVEKYDASTKQWITLPEMNTIRRNHAAAVLNGKLYACGGIGMNSVEVYDPIENSWQMVARMNQDRHEFTVIAHEGKLFAIGGDHQYTIEVYDPSRNQWQIDHQMTSGVQLERVYTSGAIREN